jgi:hypothetical protein
MRRITISAVMVIVLLVAFPSFGQQSLVGTYKLVSNVVEVDGTPSQNMGKAPYGYLVFTPTHFITFITADNRKFGTSVAEKAALLDTLAGYAGVYRVEGDKFILTPDVSWTENLNGKPQVETYQLSGNRLTNTLGPIPYPRDPSKAMIRKQVWEKVE